MSKFVLVSVLGCVFAAAFSSPVFACSCANQELVNDLREGDGEIPVNADGVGWFLNQAQRLENSSDEIGHIEDFVTVTDLDSGAEVEFELRNTGSSFFLIRPKSWAVGKRYRVSTDVPVLEGFEISPGEESDTVDIAVATEFKPSAFDISATPTEHVVTSVAEDSGCWRQIDVARTVVRPQFVGERPNVDFIHFETLVDGSPRRYLGDECEEIVPGENGGAFQMYAACATSQEWFRQRYPEGSFEVSTRAYYPGTNVSWQSEPITVMLDCGQDPLDSDPVSDATPESSGCSSVSVGASRSTAMLWLIALLCVARSKRPARIKATSRTTRDDPGGYEC